MTRTFSRRLVIDADVARAAGERDVPRSRRCRRFLLRALEICHRMALSPELAAEWRKHASGFTRSWLAQMRRKGKVVDVADPTRHELRARVAGAAASARDEQIVAKDFHLVEAALATDRLVVSMDETVRQRLASMATKFAELKPVVWVNPETDDSSAVEWLEAGARPERDGRLGGTAA